MIFELNDWRPIADEILDYWLSSPVGAKFLALGEEAARNLAIKILHKAMEQLREVPLGSDKSRLRIVYEKEVAELPGPNPSFEEFELATLQVLAMDFAEKVANDLGSRSFAKH